MLKSCFHSCSKNSIRTILPHPIHPTPILGCWKQLSKSKTKQPWVLLLCFLFSCFTAFWFPTFLVMVERLMKQKSRPWKDNWCSQLRLVLPRKRRLSFLKWRWNASKDQKRFTCLAVFIFLLLSKLYSWGEF